MLSPWQLRLRKYNLAFSMALRKSNGAKCVGPIRLFLYGGPDLILLGLRSFFEKRKEFRVTGLAHNAREAFAKVRKKVPHIVLLVGAGDVVVFETALKQFRRSFPEIKIIIFAVAEVRGDFLTLLEAGVRGYLCKEAHPSELVSALSRIRQGEFYFSESFFTRLHAQNPKANPLSPRDKSDPLTKSERTILGLIANGLSNKEMAQRLKISVRTVEKHRETIMHKLEIRSIAGLTKFAIQRGLVGLD